MTHDSSDGAEPSAQDIQFFGAHGWWVSPRILADDVLDDLRFGIERYFAGERDWQLPIRLDELGEATPVRQTDYLSLQIKEFREIIQHKSISGMAARLMGTESVRLFHDQLVTKPPYSPSRKAVVGWHADKAYWTSCSSENMVTAWIPLEDVPEESGPLAVWDGSHRWPGVETLHNFAETDLRSIEEGYRQLGFEPNIVVLPMQRGQVSFHHCRLIHGGFANRTDSPRYGYAIHMQDSSNEYVDPASAPHRGHINDLLCRRTGAGLPDYRDPDVFPLLWP